MCAPFITGKRLKEAHISAFRQHEGSLVSLSEGVSPAAGVQVVCNGNKALSTAYTGSIDHRGSSQIGTCDSWARRQSHALERDFKHVLVSWVSILTSLSAPHVHEHRTYWKVSHVLLLKKLPNGHCRPYISWCCIPLHDRLKDGSRACLLELTSLR
jgi:hypothetical protein